MSKMLELSEDTYQLLVDMTKQHQRPLEELVRICLLAYEERCYQQADQQMLA
jgi:hypothetical protein